MTASVKRGSAKSSDDRRPAPARPKARAASARGARSRPKARAAFGANRMFWIVLIALAAVDVALAIVVILR